MKSVYFMVPDKKLSVIITLLLIAIAIAIAIVIVIITRRKNHD